VDTSFREFFDRYGPTVAMIVAVFALVVFVPGNTKGGSGTSDISAGDTAATNTAGGASGASGASGAGGATDAGAGTNGATGAAGGGSASGGGSSTAAAGATTVKGETGTYPCRSDNRQSGISGYMPPCHQFDGDNGGDTAKGVSADAVKVAYYIPTPNAATQAALKAAGSGDDQKDIERVTEVLRRYYNDHYQTYGREVQFTKVNASGESSDDVAAKADAHKIADAGFFAVFTAGGTTGNPTFDSTIAQLGVICVACSVSQSNSFYEHTDGYSFGALPSAREYYEAIGEYWGKRLNGKNAEFAGPEAENSPPNPSPASLRNKKRKFGLIWLNANMGTVDPGAQEERDNFVNNILPKYGMSKADLVDASYNYDLTQGPTTAQTVISKMNSSGVTTIAQFADPLMPVFFTREATKEAYYPEWFQTGTGLTDTTFFGRTYDTQQWSHSFGISPLWVFFEHLEVSDGYREYHHACDAAKADCAPKAEATGINVYRTAQLELFTGIEMAGEKLTPETFAKGMYAYPPTGGSPAYPLFHFTRESPNIIKDFTETWWDQTRTGKDEVNNNAAGVLMKANQGKRYLPGQWPAAAPFVFKYDPSPVFTSDAPYTGPGVPTHEQDGHHHSPDEKCLSCG
jgi:hypothetical protein